MFNRYTYVGNDPLNATDPFGLDSFVVFRPASGGKHAFIVVTKSDGSIRRIFSYGPSNEGDAFNPGQLVSVGDDGESNTLRNDLTSWNNRGNDDNVMVVSLTDMGIEDDAVIESGNAINATLGSRENPGDTPYQVFPQIMRGEGCNSNCGASGVVEGARDGASGEINPPARTPGWRDPIEPDVIENDTDQ